MATANDFFGTLRNIPLSLNRNPILMIQCAPNDTIASASRDLSAKGMPFHSEELFKSIEDSLDSAHLSDTDSALLRHELERKKADRFADKKSIYEYKSLLTAICAGRVREETLDYLIANDFSEESVISQQVKDSDKLLQARKYQLLWRFIQNHSTISNQQNASALLRNIEGSNVNLIVNQSDDMREGIRYFIDVNLKGKQLDPEDIFKSFLFKNDTGEGIRNEWYNFKMGVALSEKSKIHYPLLKYIEHFFYCDLYKDPKYKGLEFNDEFRLKKEFKTKEDNSQFFRKDSHLIEVIADNWYMLNAFRKLNYAINIMTEIAQSMAPTRYFEELFKCVSASGGSSRLDSTEIVIIHNIMKKILRDSNLLPKALLMKYILSVFDGQPKQRDEYRKIYGVYLLSVLFVVFENKKSKDVLFSVLKAADSVWYDEAVLQIKSYFSVEKITDTRLLAQYKLGMNEDCEDYQFRCKSLATIYNYFVIRDSKVLISDYAALKSFLSNDEKYTTEHLIISNTTSRNCTITIGEMEVEYNIDEKCFKSYVNSIFNFIFIPRQLNEDLKNNWLPAKERIIETYDGEIECDYSNMVLSHAKSLADSFRNLKLTAENYQEKLYLFYARDFREQYITYSRGVLEAVIEKIKGAE